MQFLLHLVDETKHSISKFFLSIHNFENSKILVEFDVIEAVVKGIHKHNK